MAILQRRNASLSLHTSQARQPAPITGATARPFLLVTRLLADVTGILGGLLVAENVQHRLDPGLTQPLTSFELFNAIAILAWLALGAAFGMYDSRRLANAFDEFKLVLQTAAAGTVAATSAAFLLDVPTQRSWVLATWTACSLSTMATRWVHRRVVRRMRLAGLLVSRMLIVGAGSEGRDLHEAVDKARWLGYEVVGFLDDDRVPGRVEPGIPHVLGGTADVRDTVMKHGVEAVLVAGCSVGRASTERVYRDLQGLPVDLHLSTGLLGVAANRVAVQRFGDLPVLGLRRVDLSGFQQSLKRAFDVAVSGLALVALSPVLLACALAVRLSGPGPILFSQVRIGRDGKPFTIHKFRSMVADAEARLDSLREHNQADGLLFKLHDDPRVTRVGKFLRTWSLDELPQLIDVLRGDMSLVGPRPPLPSEVADYDDWLRNRLRVKPGLTGLWQVSGRHEASFADYVRHDLFYVENWSLSLDLYIVLRTIPAVLGRSGV